MNIEDLTKTQLLLLTILVNFIISIATGVLVVSMLDQSPTPVTQTVQQIVDHTIETISTPIATPIITKPGPVPVTPEQQLTSAVAAENARAVLIYRGATSTPAIAWGVYLPRSRAVATVFTLQLPKEATIQFSDGSTAGASLAHNNDSIAIYGFSDTAALPNAPAANPVAIGDLRQAQTAIGLTKERAVVTGIISKIDASGIITSLAGVPAGMGVVDLSGGIVGISAGDGTLYSTDSAMSLLEAPAASNP